MTAARRRTRRAAVAAAAVLTVLTTGGCAALHPGTAAVVGGDTIDHSTVDDVALALCAANLAGAAAAGEQAPALPTRGAREAALQILLEAEITRQFAETLDVEATPRELAESVSQTEQALGQLPAEHRDAFQEAVRAFNERQLLLIAAGRQALGDPAAPAEQAIAEGQRLQQEYLQGLDVEVDPRYGTFEDSAFRPGGTELSVAASERALAGGRANPSEGWVAGLPASQKCG